MSDRTAVERTGERTIHTAVRRRRRPFLRPLRGLVTLAALAGLAVTPVSLAQAAPTPSAPTPSAPTLPVEESSPVPTATPSTPTASAITTPAPEAELAPESERAKAEAGVEAALTLTVGSAGGPVPGRFFQDLGSFLFTGQAPGLTDGTVVAITRRTGSDPTARTVTSTPVRAGAFRVSLLVTDAAAYTFTARTVLPGDPSVVVQSAPVAVSVADAGITLAKPVSTIDALKNPTLTGTVVPARAGVTVNIDVLKGGKPKAVMAVRTDRAGKFSAVFGYGNATLGSFTVRAVYPAVNSRRWEKSSEHTLTRQAVLAAKITKTTAAEVAKTYRKGCPVGRSKLRTVTMNYYGRDKRMHRGVVIIRTDLTTELTRGFGRALDHRYPVAKMNNPNVYGGNDPRQMEANNTSGFNCRKVVGNPYAQSPHSYGIALDVNTVQNPYRDSRGKWWPKNGKSYIKRDEHRWGMLYRGSYLTSSLRKDHFFWGGLWNPGRDYQHFEYRR